jgi:hypothetical protein
LNLTSPLTLHDAFFTKLSAARKNPTVIPEDAGLDEASLRSVADKMSRCLGEDEVLVVQAGPMEFPLYGRRFADLFKSGSLLEGFERALQSSRQMENSGKIRYNC